MLMLQLMLMADGCFFVAKIATPVNPKTLLTF